MKFLIDECLSPELVKLAQDKGYAESSHVVWRKLAGKKDWHLKGLEAVALDGDLINQVLEITLDENDELRVLRYDLPSPDT